MLGIRRREFIALLVGATAWPHKARAEQRERMRRIGVLMSLAADDPESSSRLTTFVQTLQQLGWTDGRNVRIEIRWGAANPDLFRRHAMELVALAPDVILAGAGSTVPALMVATQSIPIVFAQTNDPVGGGFVSSLGRPGGNATGFMLFEYGLGAKWLELLKQIAPQVRRVGVLRDVIYSSASGIPLFAAIQTAAPSFGVELTAISVRDATEIEHGINDFARGPNDGLIVTNSPLTTTHRNFIVQLVAKHRLPAVYPYRYHVAAGGLMSYGPNPIDQYRGAAGYVDRILKGEKPADLPVQAPTKYELVINLKTAKALGIEIPPLVRARADEVIE
jgi:putative tryptophan/tyrosine transport system substrate-binding protein